VKSTLLALLQFAALALAGSAALGQEADLGGGPHWERPAPATQAIAQPRTDESSSLVIAALQYLDVPYRRGGAGLEGFDCSGFTRHIVQLTLGLVLPRRADEQAHAAHLRSVRQDELQPGDLVFFNTLRRTFSHVGIYMGEGRFIHAPRTGSAVRIESMDASYWARRYTGARRLPMAPAGNP
jgi:cell wall-associated NlpC family hydrolase